MTTSFDTLEAFTHLQSMLTRIGGVEPIDVSGATAVLSMMMYRKQDGSSHTLFIMSLMGWAFPTGLCAPDIPKGMLAPIVLVQKEGQPITIVDAARGLPNGYELQWRRKCSRTSDWTRSN